MKKYQYSSLESREFVFADKVEVEDNSYVNLRDEANTRKEYVFYIEEYKGIFRPVLRIPVSFLVEPPKEIR